MSANPSNGNESVTPKFVNYARDCALLAGSINGPVVACGPGLDKTVTPIKARLCAIGSVDTNP